MMFWSVHDMSGWGYAGMAIGMVLFWVLVIGGIVVLVRLSSGSMQAHQSPGPHLASPEQVLAARFARGEIDDAEYRQRLATLRGSPS